MRVLCISPADSFPKREKDNMENALQANNIELEYSEKPMTEHKGGGYDGVILAGDDKALQLEDIDLLKNILYEFMKNNKVVAAIDQAPVLLAMTGILTGKCATVNDSNELGRQLHNLGALFFAESVVVDRNVITANSPEAAVEFANTLIEVLNSENLDNTITCN